MKCVLVISFLAVALYFSLIGNVFLGLKCMKKMKEVSIKPETTFEDLLDAITWVESRNNPDAIGDDGNALGMFQIWKIYVDDVNRILNENHFTYVDRLDALESRRMVRVYLRHYGREERLGRNVTLEDYARIHNGGPNGYKKESTIKYWKKVEERLCQARGRKD